MDFSKISATGVLGDPGHASRERGQLLWTKCVEEGAAIVREIVSGEAVREAWHFKEGLEAPTGGIWRHGGRGGS
jgi:hypothetical protein